MLNHIDDMDNAEYRIGNNSGFERTVVWMATSKINRYCKWVHINPKLSDFSLIFNRLSPQIKNKSVRVILSGLLC